MLTETVHAVRHGTASEVRACLDASPNHVTAKDPDGTMLVHVAANFARVDALRLLLERSADPNAATTHQVTPLMKALKPPLALRTISGVAAGSFVRKRLDAHEPMPGDARLQVVQMLLDAGADVNPVKIPIEQTVTQGALFSFTPPLTLAAQLGDESLVRLLLERGADLDGRGYYESTALIGAVARGHANIVDLLLDAGADPNASTYNGNTAIRRCPCVAHVENPVPPTDERERVALRMLESLLRAGGKIHGTDDSGWTALHSAVNEAMPNLVQRCVDAGADLRAADDRGDPILVFVVTRILRRKLAEADMIPVAKRLREAGADVTALGSDGATAFELARNSGLKRLANICRP